jgi:HEPN domain-containing protein
MDRAGFQRLASERLADAKALLTTRRWSGAYYLAGYAVECGLKSYILARLSAEVGLVFADRRLSEKCWTHSLIQLLDVAGLKATLDHDTAADAELLDNWDVVKDWTESSRYARATREEAVTLYEAITDKKHGILRWIKVRW